MSNSEPNNPVAARRFGLTNSDGVFAQTLFSDVQQSIEVAGHAAGNNEIEMTFDEDDVYRLKFVFDGAVDSGGTATLDKEIKILEHTKQGQICD